MSTDPAPEPAIPSFAELAADPDIAPLLEFEPVPRQLERADGWDAEAQRAFIAALAVTGSPKRAADAVGMAAAGAHKLRKGPGSAGFRAAWERALAHHAARRSDRLRSGVAALTAGTSSAPDGGWAGLPGQVINEHGEWEDEDSYLRRGEDARDSIAMKLLRIRRLYLQEISASPGKRAAFEILTELPIDWDLAAKGDPQPEEPWNHGNQRQPDMILTAESGWSAGDIGYGPDKKAELRQAIDEYRAENGFEPIDWSESTERRDAGA